MFNVGDRVRVIEKDREYQVKYDVSATVIENVHGESPEDTTWIVPDETVGVYERVCMSPWNLEYLSTTPWEDYLCIT